MEKCDCYHVTNRLYYNARQGTTKSLPTALCYGTKEKDECYCGGDKSQCDFYLEVREKAKKELNTAEMYLAAQDDGAVYETNYCNTRYSKENGFWSESQHNFSDTPSLNEWMNAMWHKQEKRKLTRVQAENEFDIEIID